VFFPRVKRINDVGASSLRAVADIVDVLLNDGRDVLSVEIFSFDKIRDDGGQLIELIDIKRDADVIAERDIQWYAGDFSDNSGSLFSSVC